MNKSLLVAALLALALTACSKKEEAVAALPAPATAPALPNASSPVEAPRPAEPTTLQAPAAPVTPSGENTTAK